MRPKEEDVQADDNRQVTRFYIRTEWWEPVAWWLKNTQWTVIGLETKQEYHAVNLARALSGVPNSDRHTVRPRLLGPS